MIVLLEEVIAPTLRRHGMNCNRSICELFALLLLQFAACLSLLARRWRNLIEAIAVCAPGQSSAWRSDLDRVSFHVTFESACNQQVCVALG
jgi:hypothetical protein